MQRSRQIRELHRWQWTAAAPCIAIALAAVFLGASLASASAIEIDPGAYAYPYSIDSQPPVTGPVTIDLSVGTHVIETGGYVDVRGIASSRFRFTVTPTGDVANVASAVTGQPSGAATARGRRLVFNQVGITIDPGRFRDAYYLQYGKLALVGTQTVVLLPDVAYLLEHAPLATTAKGDPSGFYFVLDRAGRIVNVLTPAGMRSASAVGSGTRLWLNR